MADILVSALVQTVLENLTSRALREIRLAWGLKDELKSLESILRRVQLVLQDAEQKQRKDKVLQDWLLKLKHAAYDAEDVLEEITIEAFKRRRGLEHLNSLEHLRLWGCHCLTSFPATILQDLSSLRSLYISGCKRMNPLSGELQRESALESLWIDDCPEFNNFPESMQQLTSLRCLIIWNCEELRSVPNWVGRLQLLSTIEIRKKYLNSLPDGFQTPESLRCLLLDGCDPQLEKRCKKPEGEDWPKISHIPEIIINGNVIQQPNL